MKYHCNNCQFNTNSGDEIVIHMVELHDKGTYYIHYHGDEEHVVREPTATRMNDVNKA